jgi:hypothetical protein
MQADLDVTDLLLAQLGTKHQSEIDAMNAAIRADVAQGALYENQMNALIALHAAQEKIGDASHIFDPLQTSIDSFTSFIVASANAINTAANKPPVAAAPSAAHPVATGTVNNPAFTTVSVGGSNAPALVSSSGYYQITPFGVRPVDQSFVDAGGYNPGSIVKDSGFGNALVPAFASGIENVPKDMMAYLHAGEQVVPAAMVRAGRTGGDTNNMAYAPNLSVNLTINGPADRAQMRRLVRDEIIPQLMDAMDVNSRNIVNRMSNSLAPRNQNKPVYK